ncbi:MAG: ATP-binding protein, partial [Sulfitobacter sp.]
LSAKQEAYLHNMDTSGRLLLRHVSDVLDIARYDSGMITAREEPFNVSGLVQDIVDSQSSMALAHNTTLEWGWNGAHQHWIIGDMERLQHVLMNLIGNAVKFTKDGRVTIAAIWGNDRIRFEIEDTGIGVSEDLQEHIFDDFVTGDTSYGREVGGSGLGLSIVKRFVGVLGGKVWVHSVAGIGSTFTVEIPTIPAAPPSEQQATDQILPTPSPQRILVVEDNEINRFVVRSMLEADGHHVTDAMDGQDGVDRAYQEKFDLILMDISMPVLDGRIATQMIREGKGASAHSRIIALTANALPEERADFLTLGMEDVLTKPLSKSALRAALVGHPPKQTIVFDADHLRETREVLGEKNFQKVLSKFHSELDAVQTWPQSDMPLPEIAAQAHKFSGSAALFGASSLVACLQELEATARNGAPPQAMLKISEAATLCASTQQALTAFKAG